MNSLSESNKTLMGVQTKFDSAHAQCQTLQISLDESNKVNRQLSKSLDVMTQNIRQLEARVNSLQNEAGVKVSDVIFLLSYRISELVN